MLVVENRNEAHLAPALWGFPLYLLAINLFVLPIAFAGLLLLPAGGDPDMVVLTLPLAAGAHWLSLLALIGGLSAATAMVVVESVALSTMVCNELLLPVLLRQPGREQADVTGLLLGARRAGIVELALGPGMSVAPKVRVNKQRVSKTITNHFDYTRNFAL